MTQPLGNGSHLCDWHVPACHQVCLGHAGYKGDTGIERDQMTIKLDGNRYSSGGVSCLSPEAQ